MKLILRAADVQIILNVCRTDSYRIIKEIKEDYHYSGLLTGSKIKIEDLAEHYKIKVEEICALLSEHEGP